MLGDTNLPQELTTALGSEAQDFAVKAERVLPVKKCLGLIALSVGWLAFMSMFIINFFGPLLAGQEATFKVNDVPTTVGPGNWSAMVGPGLIILVLTVIGFAFFVWGVMALFQSGGYFVGTPTRLVSFKKGSLRSMNWNNFSGDITVSGNAQKGDVSLRMSEGKMQSSRNGRSRYVADMVYLAGIPNVFEIEKLLRKRISENSSAPATNA